MVAEPAVFAHAQSDTAPQLLVADDSQVQRSALSAFLRKRGYAVAEAGDGVAAVRHLKSCPVDLLLLDLNMPQGDGFEVLSYLQAHRRALPVILLSGMPVDDIQRKMNKLPERHLPPLLLKPVDPEQLITVVELQLSGEMPDVGPAEAV
jgi:two-component system chemotaxis response regulator CheY